MASTSLSLLLLHSLISLLFSTSQILAQSPSAPAPSPPGPINITGILDKAGQYTIFIRLLTATQAATQINSQVNNSNQGVTVFAPTDNAFNNLPAGTLNNLSSQQQVQVVLYHVVPQYYSLSDLRTVSNPVRTQASGQDGGVFGLYFYGEGNQLNVSTGTVATPINNALRQESPLAVYQVDKVLIPKEFTEAKAPTPPPPAANTTLSGTSNGTTAPAPSGNDSKRLGTGLGLVAAFGLLCMELLS